MYIPTKRTIIRSIKQTDAEALYYYRSDSKTAHFLSLNQKNVDDMRDFITKSARDVNQPGTWFQVAIVLRETNKVIGDIGLHFIDSEPQVQVEIGYTLSTEYQRKGLATEALTAIIDYLFNSLNKYRITASVDPLNTPSIGLLERLGFRKEAHFKKSLFFKGEWVDDVVYGMLKEDFKPVLSK